MATGKVMVGAMTFDVHTLDTEQEQLAILALCSISLCIDIAM